MDENPYTICPVCKTSERVDWCFPFQANCRRCDSMWTVRGAEMIQLKNLPYHKAADVWWGTSPI